MCDETEIIFLSYLDGNPTLNHTECTSVAELFEFDLLDTKAVILTDS
jgi:hypothetical protein